MPRFHHHGPEAGILKAVDQPLGQRASLEPDALDIPAEAAQAGDTDGRLLSNRTSPPSSMMHRARLRTPTSKAA
jgi:hypothetical protein